MNVSLSLLKISWGFYGHVQLMAHIWGFYGHAQLMAHSRAVTNYLNDIFLYSESKL